VRFEDFQALITRLSTELPPPYLDGVVEVTVSPKTLPHPVRGDVYTLGECIPLEWSAGPDLQSRIVLYHGSFAALARLGELDWRKEAWETLTHELRHHLEWRADLSSLEAYDWAAEENFARHDGQPFDPVFYRNGEEIAPQVFKVEDDVFVERDASTPDLQWHGRRYWVTVPDRNQRSWGFYTLAGLDEPPPGDAVLVIPARSSVFDLFRKPVPPTLRELRVERDHG
jgi:hypothetical protein